LQLLPGPEYYLLAGEQNPVWKNRWQIVVLLMCKSPSPTSQGLLVYAAGHM
jgi:hypothetical protein